MASATTAVAGPSTPDVHQRPPPPSQRPTFRTLNSTTITLEPIAFPRSSSSNRVADLGWNPPPSLPVTREGNLQLESSEHRRSQPHDAYRSWRQESYSAQQAKASRALGIKTRPPPSVTGKGKGRALTFVVGAPSSGSGDEADLEGGTGSAVHNVESEFTGDEEEDGQPASPKELSVEEVIRWQVRQPVYSIDSQDLDSILQLGIGDYTWILQPSSAPSSDAEAEITSKPASVLTPSKVGTTAPPPPLNRVSLGKGKFSEVLLARKGNTEYAVKHTPLHPHHPLIATRLLREPTILAQLIPHPNLVKVYETIRTPGHFYLVEENLSDSITLEALVSGCEGGVLPPAQAWSVLDQLASVVRSLHEPLRVCHRDIKPENIVVKVTPAEDPNESPTLLLKLLDFGLATHYSGSEAKLTTCCGSPAYHSPELWRSLREPSGSVKYWGPEVDVWCVGLTLLRCLTPNKYPLGISHSSIFALSDKVVDALLAVQDESLRNAIAPLMQMDGQKRMRAFEAFCESRPPAVDLNTSQVAKKEFKSTSFLPGERTHSLDLPLSPKGSHATLTRSPSRSRRPRFTPDFAAAPVAELSFPGSGTDSPDLTPDQSPLTVSNASLPPTPRTYSRERLSSHPSPIELVLLNPTDEPIRRAASYVKYALRCAGILYHVRDNMFDSAFSAVATSVDEATENDSAFVCQLQCVIKLPNTEQSRASTALIAALRPPMTRAHTTGNHTRSSSTPATGKGQQKKKEEVKSLTFFVSIRKCDVDYHEAEQQMSEPLQSRRRSSDSLSRIKGGRSSRRRSDARIVVTLSDARALPAVRDALKLDENAPPMPSEAEERRGREGPSQELRKPGRVGSGSREARSRRSRTAAGGEEAIVESAAGSTVSARTPSAQTHEKKPQGFFDFAFGKFPSLGSASQTPAASPVLEVPEHSVEEARAQALAAVAF